MVQRAVTAHLAPPPSRVAFSFAPPQTPSQTHMNTNTVHTTHDSNHGTRTRFTEVVFVFIISLVYWGFRTNLHGFLFSVWLRIGFRPTCCLQQNIISVTPYYAPIVIIGIKVISPNWSFIFVWYRFCSFITCNLEWFNQIVLACNTPQKKLEVTRLNSKKESELLWQMNFIGFPEFVTWLLSIIITLTVLLVSSRSLVADLYFQNIMRDMSCDSLCQHDRRRSA